MPDTLGDIYEGILAHCLLSIGGWSVETSPQRPTAICRNECPHASLCLTTGMEPAVEVDPDMMAEHGDGTIAVGLITHWRTTSFNKKFWRTVEEILEYGTHIPSTRRINFIAEKMGEADNLRDSLSRLAGNSVSLHKNWSPLLGEAVEHLETVIVKELSPMSPEAVREFCDENYGKDELLTCYLDAVRDSLQKSLPLKPGEVSTETLQSDCMSARESASSWRIRDISALQRTAVQLLALIVFAAERDGHEISVDEFSRGMFRVVKGARSASLARLSNTPYRVQKGTRSSFVAVNTSITGKTVIFEPSVFSSELRSPETLDLARRYLAFLRRHPIWSGYLDRFCESGVSERMRRSEITRENLREIVDDAIIKKKKAWMLDTVLASLSISRVKLGSDLNKPIQETYGVPIRKISPFGDEPKNVIAYCARGESDKLNAIPGKTLDQTHKILADHIDTYLAARISKPIEFSAAIAAHKVRDMRTFLSGAPHPALGAISEMLDRLLVDYETNFSVPTIFTSWYGGNSGKTTYQFQITHGSSSLFVKVATGQDGNEGHKWKELAGRRRAHRLVSSANESAWLILDGTWDRWAVRKLYEAGYERVFSIDEVEELESNIVRWMSLQTTTVTADD